MNDDTILVLGASGTTGSRVAARLRLRGIPVRAASRSSATRFDWSDPTGWDDALKDVSTVYLIAPVEIGPVHDFVARAQAAGVRRLVLLSGHHADRWGDSLFGRDMRAAEDAVRGSGLEWTVVRASNFFQNFAGLWGGPIAAGELGLPVAATAPEPFVDVEDVAEAVATVLVEPGRHAGRTYELTGARPLTFADTVEVIARATDRPVVYRQLSAEGYVDDLVAQGWTREAALHETAMYDLIDGGLIADTTTDLSELLGRPPRSFEDFAVRTAAQGTWGRG